MRRYISVSVLALVAALATTAGLVNAVGAASENGARPPGGNEFGQVNKQVLAWREIKQNINATSSKKWREFGSSVALPAPGPVSVQLSVKLSGDPVDIRLFDSGRLMAPGKISFNPGRRDARSFTFVSSSDAPCRTITVQWRSRTGNSVESNGHSIAAYYSDGPSGVNCQ